ncbi:PREDICTED: endocuticle structural protein SgAbd-6-like [Dinoponera quadriceps]|uniref:Endocuticle structural protein SgAbd-6-like n=1 Tax=Dinoponera quadriceps TaxID=609295 RepID=A0A6P3Y6Q4_DINQU|nr:PREDICTED: endocuticle structural protein SgAbd-6-like [Dinoponera quadriceps]
MHRRSLVSRIARRCRLRAKGRLADRSHQRPRDRQRERQRKRERAMEMKTILVIWVVLVAGALAAPQLNPNEITIVKQEEVNNIGVGGYRFSYEQSDGQKREETAELKNEGTDNEAMSVVGSFSFIAPDGHTYRVDYTADETGFHPSINLVAK